MYKYNIYVGMFDKDTKKQEIPSQEFFNTVRKIMRLNWIDNFTIIKAKGHYKSDTMTVCEPTIIIDFISSYNFDKISFDCIRNQLCKELNQESVLITKQSIEVL